MSMKKRKETYVQDSKSISVTGTRYVSSNPLLRAKNKEDPFKLPHHLMAMALGPSVAGGQLIMASVTLYCELGIVHTYPENSPLMAILWGGDALSRLCNDLCT